MNNQHQIGTLGEKSLHAELKEYYAKPGDKIEEKVQRYHIDILRGKNIIEIQTRTLGALKKKISALENDYKIQIIHPIAKVKWIVRATKKGKEKSRRKSPKRGRIEDIFIELVNAPNLIQHKNVSLKVVFIHMEELWIDDGKGSWRRKKWSIGDRRLVKVLDGASMPLKLFSTRTPTSGSCGLPSHEMNVAPILAGKSWYPCTYFFNTLLK